MAKSRKPHPRRIPESAPAWHPRPNSQPPTGWHSIWQDPHGQQDYAERITERITNDQTRSARVGKAAKNAAAKSNGLKVLKTTRDKNPGIKMMALQKKMRAAGVNVSIKPSAAG